MLKKVKRNRKGFTLIELIVVIAILAILAAVAVPSLSGLQTEARVGVLIANASEVATAINIYNSLYPDEMITASELTTVSTNGVATFIEDDDVQSLIEKLGTLAPNLEEDYKEAAYKAVTMSSTRNVVTVITDRDILKELL